MADHSFWKSLMAFIVFLQIFSLTSESTVTTCPPATVLWPCSCILSTIYCYQGDIVRVEPILERVAKHLKISNGQARFIGLELDGLAVRHLPANFTSGISFEKVALKNLDQLTSIDSNAFVASQLLQLSLEGSSSAFLLHQNLPQLTRLVSALPNLERLYLDLYHLEGFLPPHLFIHDRLSDLSFNYNRVQRGKLSGLFDESFYYLPSLRTIDLYGQQITHIKRDAFRFRNYVGQVEPCQPPSTAIFLQDNNLTENSFEIGTFTTTSATRQLSVFLGGNNITTVREDIFRPLLEGNPSANKVDFGDNRLRHSCANMWVTTVDTRYRQFLGAMVHFNETEHRVLVAFDVDDYADLNCTTSS